MKKKSIMHMFIVSALLGFTTMLISCSDDGDTTKPTITLNAPEEGTVFYIGDEDGMYVDIDLADDVMLSTYKVNIHPNFDGHSHSRSENSGTTDFEYNKVWDLSGQKQTTVRHNEIKIPANATPGNYHLMVFCTDTSGNESYVAKGIILSLGN